MKSVLFIRGHCYALDNSTFRRRYELLSKHLNAHVLATGDIKYDGVCFSNTTLHIVERKDSLTIIMKFLLWVKLVIRACKVARQNKIDVVVSYDPLFLGMVAIIVSFFSSASLIIEINGHLKGAKAKKYDSPDSIMLGLQGVLYTLCCYMVLCKADCIKLLNEEQFFEWKLVLKKKPCYMFHDFVLTSEFVPIDDYQGNYIFCAGFPFYLKGVDTLLEAFKQVRAEFPYLSLVVMGYCPEPQLEEWQAKFREVPNAYLKKPVENIEVVPYMQKCMFLVLPSRCEAMGRVLIEAMACGKAVIGSRAGGIPNIILDGVNGLLFDQNHGDSVEQLANSIRQLASDYDKLQFLGKNGLEMVTMKFSEDLYIEYYAKMLEQMASPNNKSMRRYGIVFSGYKANSLFCNN